MVDRRVTFGDLKGVLTLALRASSAAHTPLRFRASFFPFTEPSAEVDIGCVLCRGSATRTAASAREAAGWKSWAPG